MPKVLFADRPEHVVFKEYEDPPLGPTQYRVRTEFGSIKHGTGFHQFSGHSPFADRVFDPVHRLFLPRTDGAGGQASDEPYLGNMVVGQVTQVGREVKRFKVGDRIYRYGPLAQTQTVEEKDGQLLGALRPEDAVCLDPGLFAYGAIRDGRVAIGDHVVLFGLGAIGLLGVQLLRIAGCARVIAVDPVEKRRKVAESFGADLVLDPAGDSTGEDVALRIRRFLGRGADIAIEASGHYGALRQAIRSVGQCGRVTTIGFYRGADSQLELGAEFLHNRVELIASLPAWGNPLRDLPLWDKARVTESLAELFRAGRLTARGIVEPVVPFAECDAAFMRAYRDPTFATKLGVTFP